jgi:hypothetical protein
MAYSLPNDIWAMILSDLDYKEMLALQTDSFFKKHLTSKSLAWKLHFEKNYSTSHRTYFDYQREIENYYWFLEVNRTPSIVNYAAIRNYEILLETVLKDKLYEKHKVDEAFEYALQYQHYHLTPIFLKYYEFNIFIYFSLPLEWLEKYSHCLNRRCMLDQCKKAYSEKDQAKLDFFASKNIFPPA